MKQALGPADALALKRARPTAVPMLFHSPISVP